MQFRTQYDEHDRFYTEPGDPEKILYGPMFDKDGVMNLIETGKEDLYGYIQSHAESVDIHVILQRFEAGDASVLTRVQGAYGDFTQMPKTYAEMLNSMIGAETYFNSLPVEIRANFGHSFSQFLASVGDEDFAQRLGKDVEQPVGDQAKVTSMPEIPDQSAPIPQPIPEPSST